MGEHTYSRVGCGSVRSGDSLRRTRVALGVVLTLLQGVGTDCGFAADSPQRVGGGIPAVRRAAGFGSLNGFVANHGQWSADVRFVGVAGGIEATLLDDALVFRPAPLVDRGVLKGDAAWETSERPAPIVLRLPGAANVLGEDPLVTRHHFLLGSDRSRWAKDVPGYRRVHYRDVAPGIDLVLRVETDVSTRVERFVYDVVVAPGADLESFSMNFEGLSGTPDLDGRVLFLPVSSGMIEHRLGASWEIDPVTGARMPVEARYAISVETPATAIVGYEVTNRDPSRALVIDPSLAWATYVGGVSQEFPKEIKVDASGATYLACNTPFGTPTTPSSYTPVSTPSSNVWIGKLSSDGSALLWATFLGGEWSENVVDFDIDTDGTIVVLGGTQSATFPVTEGAYQTNYLGTPHVKGEPFITRLTPDGSSLVWSTFYGGPDSEETRALALFPNGDVLIACQPTVAQPGATLGVFDPVFTEKKEFLARLKGDGTQVIFHTYFLATTILDMVIDADENIYFAGEIAGMDGVLPATPGAFKTSTSAGPTKLDGFIAKMSPDGTFLHWATYLGGESKADTIYGLAIDAARAVYVVGDTSSADYPVTPGAFALTEGGNTDGFVTKLLPNGSNLVWSTYLGGSCCQAGGYQRDLGVDRSGNVITVGSTNEMNFPITADAFQPYYIGSFPSGDLNVTKLDAFGETLVYSTYFGGSGTDYFPKVALGPDQSPHVVGMSYSSDAPVTVGSYARNNGGDADLLIAKFDLEPLPWEVMGGGKKGTNDTPNLAGGGWLTPGAPTRISLRGAANSAPAILFAGLQAIDVPVLGGTFVPAPAVVVPLSTHATGGFDLPFAWPNAPVGISLYMQVWVADPGATGGWSASNALKATAQ